MADITYKRTLTGKEFEIATEHFNIIGRILLAGTGIDSLTGHVSRIGGNFYIGTLGFQNGGPVFRFDDYITGGEAAEIAAAVDELVAEQEE